jgi:hypothetical protein
VQYRLHLVPRVYLTHRVYAYETLMRRMLGKAPVPYKRFRAVTPRWDNSPRRGSDSVIFRDSTPELYESWLRALIRSAIDTCQGDERLVFVNAWNEWAEGSHLEPDQLWGRAYLEATARAVEAAQEAHPLA